MLPTFKELSEKITKDFPAGLTDGKGNLTGMVYYGAKAMYDEINARLQNQTSAQQAKRTQAEVPPASV